MSRYLCVPAIFSLILLSSKNILSIISVPLHVLICFMAKRTVCLQMHRVHLTIMWLLCCRVAYAAECRLGEVSRLVLFRASMLTFCVSVYSISYWEQGVQPSGNDFEFAYFSFQFYQIYLEPLWLVPWTLITLILLKNYLFLYSISLYVIIDLLCSLHI